MEEQLDNLTYGQALEHLKQGRAITRAVWGGYWLMEHARFTESNAPNQYIPLAHTKYGQHGPAQPYWEDMLANDWKVLSATDVSLTNQKIAVWAPGQHKASYAANIPGGQPVGNEGDARHGLDTTGYASKWAKAKVYAAQLFPNVASPDHWDAVRLHFLELGGDWQKSMSTGEPNPTYVGTASSK